MPRPPVVPLVEEIFRRYSFTGTVRKCRKELAGIQCDKFKGYHYISAVIPKDAGSNTFVLRDDATGELVGFNAYGSHVGKTAADDKRKFLHSKRLVIFPWWQGMGLGPLLSECVASYAINGGKFRYGSVTANAGLAAHRDRSALWKANKGSGKLSKPGGAFNVEGHEGREAYIQYSHEYVGSPFTFASASASAPATAQKASAAGGSAPAGTSSDADAEVITLD